MRPRHVARGQLRVVGQQRARTGHDGIHAGAQTVDEFSRTLRSDPAGIARQSSGLSVHGHGTLHRYKGKPCCYLLDEGLIKLTAPGFEKPDLDLDTRFPESFDASAAHHRIRVDHPDKDPGDPCRDNSIGTGRSFSEMGTGFECHIKISAFGTLTGLPERVDLGMGRAGFPVPPFADNFAALYDNRADSGIGRCFADTLAGKLYRPFHEPFIESVHRGRPLSRADPFCLRAPFCSTFSRS